MSTRGINGFFFGGKIYVSKMYEFVLSGII